MLQAFITNLYSYKGKMGLLIGEYSIKLLCIYIYGAGDAFAICGYKDVSCAFSKQWLDFVDTYYGLEAGMGIKGWYNIILEHCENEEQALDTFFDLLKKYLNHYYPQIIIPE